jgi:hypothetical protein
LVHHVVIFMYDVVAVQHVLALVGREPDEQPDEFVLAQECGVLRPRSCGSGGRPLRSRIRKSTRCR